MQFAWSLWLEASAQWKAKPFQTRKDDFVLCLHLVGIEIPGR